MYGSKVGQDPIEYYCYRYSPYIHILKYEALSSYMTVVYVLVLLVFLIYPYACL